ncbi:hypothetical protein [Belliella pelovolcani]|uniref:hypothetical protein n=1 Tax=Belliella pelovolcani TaxID=529505 RepID=UPI003918AC92
MKAYEIPVSTGVLKMIKRDYGYSKHMRIDRMIIGKAQGDPLDWKKYIENTLESQVRITLVCKYVSEGKLYTIAKLLENEFKTKMLLYLEGAVDNGMDLCEGIRKFMDKYDLTDEDLEMETARKRWYRYKKKEFNKNMIPLW